MNSTSCAGSTRCRPKDYASGVRPASRSAARASLSASGRAEVHRCVVSFCAMSVFRTLCSVVDPLSEPTTPDSKSIQPSLKPSSMRMRGVGLLMPCPTNSSRHVSRGTSRARTGLPNNRRHETDRGRGARRLLRPESAEQTFSAPRRHDAGSLYPWSVIRDCSTVSERGSDSSRF